MKKLLVIMIGLLNCVGWAGEYRVSPELGLLILQPDRITQLQEPVLQKTENGWQVETIVRFDGPQADLAEIGSVRFIHYPFAIVSVPVTNLEKLATSPVVQYAELSRIDLAKLNVSTDSIRAVDARSEYGVTGKDVIVGVIDSGIDWQHEDFINADGTTRIKCLLDFSSPGSYYGGRLYTEQDINDALNGISNIFEHDFSGHGTHVAGIAAGDGSSNAQYGSYAGVAPNADLVVVKATRNSLSNEFQTADQIISLHFIDSVATALHKPYVVNMSLGGHWGAHNGTTVVEQFIDELTGPGIPGKAVITVAGNEGDSDIHAQAKLSGAIQSRDITLQISPYFANYGANNDLIALDIWYNPNQTVSVTVITPNGNEIGPVGQGEWDEGNLNEGKVYLWNGFYDKGGEFYNGFDPVIGAYEIYIELSDSQAGNPPTDGVWTLRFTGSQGDVDAWVAAVTNLGMNPQFVQGKQETGKVSTPGTAKNVITVGAYVSKKFWTDLDGNSLTFDPSGDVSLGDLASFSSPGPTRDDRIKPEITAPGHIIESSYSMDAPPSSSGSIFSGSASYPNGYLSADSLHGLSSGTSMAGPHVTGTVALIFEQYHDSTAYPSAIQVRNMLTQSARKGKFTGDVPNSEWGYGMLDVFLALQQSASEETPVTYDLMNIYPNPFYTTATISFKLPINDQRHRVNVVVYNVLGQRVRTLMNERLSAGSQIFWDGRDDLGYLLASGVYFVEFKSGGFHQIKKVSLLGIQ